MYRSAEDPNSQEGTLADRVFRPVETKKSEKIKEESKANKEKILSHFKDIDLGKYDTPKLVPVPQDDDELDEIPKKVK